MHVIEQGHTGRIFYVRIHPNEDLVQSLEKTFLESDLAHAVVRTGVGSLAHCCLEFGAGKQTDVGGPAIEILNLAGEIFCDEQGNPIARLSGMVVDIKGEFHAGRFVTGRNPACMTVEVVLEEWVVDETIESS